jgi:hypothetical protein
MASDVPTTATSPRLECGASVQTTTGDGLRVTGRFPGTASAGEGLVSGTVEVAATGGGARGVVTPLADAFLVREGRVVTLPAPQDAVGREIDLGAGTVEQLPAVVALTPCAGGQRLATGTYDLYVRVVLNRDDGTSAASIGGPWPLEVR